MQIVAHIFTTGPRAEFALMILTLAGRRIDSPDAEEKRFPLENVAFVKARLKELFETHDPVALVCSAACGADLLALDLAGRMGIARHVVLPFDASNFRQVSVADRPGEWGPLFDKICAEVLAHRTLIELPFRPGDNQAYLQANLALLDKAEALADTGLERPGHAPGINETPAVTAIIVWEGRARGNEDMTEHFRQEAGNRGFAIQFIPTIKP